MKLVWTKVHYFGKEDLITWGLEEPCSHFAIIFNSGAVLHSDFWHGVNITTEKEFFKDRVLVFARPLVIPFKTEEYLLEKAMDKLDESKSGYDYKYMLYLVKEALKLKLCRNKIDMDVDYESNNQIICHEILEWLGLLPHDFDQKGANTPYRLYKKLGEVWPSLVQSLQKKQYK